MPRTRFTLIAAAIGVILPGLIIAAYRIPGAVGPMKWLAAQVRLDLVLLLLAPSSVILMADYDNTSFVLAAACLIANACLYGVLGWLIWTAWHRSRGMLAVPAFIVASIWILALTT